MPVSAAAESIPGPGGILEDLFEEYGRRLFRTALKITGRVSDAEDVVQTVFLRLATGERFRSLDDQPSAYLHRAAVHAAIDVVRRRRRAGPLAAEDEERLTELGAGPDRRTRGREAREALRQALGVLAPRAAEMFTLRYLEGLSNQEVAEQTGTSSGVVRVTLHRARRRLRAEMSEHLEATS
jgi:RNA polymerase sigma-70 factor (ECF subfamily)